jgi:two-component system, cell cycle sensor histidine kinase and response regulator CckA
MKFNIRLRLVLFTFSIVLLVGGSISLHSVFLGQQRMLAAFEQNARRIAALMAGAVVNQIYFQDIGSLRRRLQSARVNSDIMYTLTMDAEGAVLSDGTSANILQDKKPADPFINRLLQANDWISEVEGELLKVGGPVFMPDRSRVGYITIGFSLQRINDMVHETTKSGLYVTAFALGIGFLLACAVAASFSRPILTVTRAAKDIREGRLDTRLSVSRSDELGMLAHSVNLMAETLQRRDAEVRESMELLKQEIAERNQAEEGLRQSEERFRSLVSVITDVPWVADPTGAFVTAQPAWEAYTGQSWEEHRAFGWGNALHPEDRERVKEIWKEACASSALYYCEERLWYAPRQQWRFVVARATPLMNGNGSVREWVGTCTDVHDQKRAQEWLETTVAERSTELRQANAALLRDIEERHKLEEQLLHAQKMESMGTMAGGIAHDFNNILNIIQGYASLLQGYGARNKEIAESLTVIHQSVQRGSTLVQQLLTLARQTKTDFEYVNTNDLIKELIALITHTFPKTIALSTILEPDLPPITADENQIEQALLNLCVNARDAMPEGGRLTFTTHTVNGAAFRGSDATKDGQYVCIEVSDSGTGMNESISKRIFEPFFTTKDVGKGTGLGLSVVYGIVQNHGGFINVESKPGAGTCFRLYLPATASGVSYNEPIVDLNTETNATSIGAATVLLVEDEQNMLNVLERILVQHGYKVLKATDGEKALEIYRCHDHTIDAVLLDIGLPKVSGRDVLREIKNDNPDVKIIVASGYLEPELKAEVDRAGVNHFLHKPYMLDEVVKAVQSVIRT